MYKLMILIAALCALLFLSAPFAIVHYHRNNPKSKPRIHLVHDMDNQSKYKSQASMPAFADGRAMRPPVTNTIEYSPEPFDEAFERGTEGEAWIDDYPASITVDVKFLAGGAERFMIYCAPCHGSTGAGDGAVALAAQRRGEATWVAPTVLTSPDVSGRPNGHLFNTISKGIRNMPGYESQIPVHDRWAIVAYLRQLQEQEQSPPGN